MNILYSLIVIGTILSTFSFGQCEVEPKLSPDLKIVKKLTLSTASGTVGGLSIRAKAPDASWGRSGSEAPVITVFVNGVYSQDVIIFGGSQEIEYKVLLGRVEGGKHEILLTHNTLRSAKNAGRVVIVSAKAVSLTSENQPLAQKLAIEHSPFIYARQNAINKFTDIPLVTYYEVLPVKEGSVGIRYTTIFSNEDGGTQTTALLARWGRATDIEWVYEVWFKDGKRVSETYQGANHEVRSFTGRRVSGNHPLINTVTNNNNFLDSGCSRIRTSLVPVYADLSKRSRETVMDDNPWTYRIMAEEAIREGRVDPANLGVNVVDDLRNYLYVEVYTESEGSAFSIEVGTADGKKGLSDHNDERLRVGRPGFQRIAVRLPPGAPLESIKLNCHQISGRQTPGKCGLSQLVGYVRLDKSFRPTMINPKSMQERSLSPGMSVEWKIVQN